VIAKSKYKYMYMQMQIEKQIKDYQFNGRKDRNRAQTVLVHALRVYPVGVLLSLVGS